MGYKELIDSLRKEGEEKVQAVRNETEAEEAGIRADTARKIDRLRAECGRQEASSAKTQEEDLLSSADKTARVIMLSAEKTISDRLFALSLKCLHDLRGEGYDSALSAMVRELPPAPWSYVRVNPADTDMVRTYFPESEIVSDENISGGMEVAADSGRIHIINTFEKRLERAWDEMLPSLVRDVYEEASQHGTPSEN